MPKEKFKTMLTQNFRGQTKCIMGNVGVVNGGGGGEFAYVMRRASLDYRLLIVT